MGIYKGRQLLTKTAVYGKLQSNPILERHRFMKLKNIAFVLMIASAATVAKPWSSASGGLDMSYLYWEHGGDCVWGFQSAFGPRIIDDLYFRVKITIPAPIFIIIGNQINIGGEFSYLLRNPQEGFAVETSLGAAWSLMWPENIIVILADGESTTPPREYAYDGGNGIRLEALVSTGYKFSMGALWLDLGVDHRIMDITRTVDGEKEDGTYTFTGPHLGISADFYF